MSLVTDKKPTPPPPPAAPPRQSPPPGVPSNTSIATATGPLVVTGSDPGKPLDTKDDDGPDEEAVEKAANRSKVYIVVGDVHEFATAAQAEKFLNQPDAPKKFTVLRGHKVESKQRVSLRG